MRSKTLTKLLVSVTHCTEVRFASFFSGGFIAAIVVNPPERKLANMAIWVMEFSNRGCKIRKISA